LISKTKIAILSPAEKFLKVTQAGGKLDAAKVEKLYNQLEPVTIEAMLGEWEGGSIDTGHPGHVQMLAMNADNVQPIIVYDEAGKRRYAEELSKGLARV
jgi:hypothetical protein